MGYRETNSELGRRAVSARWDPQARHDIAMRRIQEAIHKALQHPDVKFTKNDISLVITLMRPSDR